jgi:uncharacterized tellurite resistance protein B-like protein
MDIVTKKKLNILIQLAKADHDFAAVERDLIFQIAREHNYPDEEVSLLIDNPEPIGSLGALSEKQKEEYLLSSVELVMADHRVMDSEILFTQHIAIKLGFFKNVVDYLLANFDKRRELRLSDFRQV